MNPENPRFGGGFSSGARSRLSPAIDPLINTLPCPTTRWPDECSLKGSAQRLHRAAHATQVGWNPMNVGIIRNDHQIKPLLGADDRCQPVTAINVPVASGWPGS